MPQKKLVLTVKDINGNVQFSKDPATGNDVISSLTLFDEIGTSVIVTVDEFVSPAVTQS